MGTDNKKEAERALKDREGRVVRGGLILSRVDRIRYDEAAADLRQHYTASGRRDPEEAGSASGIWTRSSPADA